MHRQRRKITYHTTGEKEYPRQKIDYKNSKPWNSNHKFFRDPKSGISDTKSACEDSKAVLDRTNEWVVAGFGVLREVFIRCD